MSYLRKFLFLFFVLVSLFPARGALFGDEKKSAEEERSFRLQNGEILTDGGHLSKGVWGRMEGVIEAPPELVWRLFILADHWKSYGLPTLADSRVVDQEIVQRSASLKKVKDFYKILGDRIVDPLSQRARGRIWTSTIFQYYDLPWPVANRWVIAEYVNDEREIAKGIIRSRWTKAAGDIRTFSGTITFEPFGGDLHRTLMVYRVESDPGSHVPKFLIRWALRQSMPEAIEAIRRQAARAQSIFFRR